MTLLIQILTGWALIALIAVWGESKRPLVGVLPLVPVFFLMGMWSQASGTGPSVAMQLRTSAMETSLTLPAYLTYLIVFCSLCGRWDGEQPLPWRVFATNSVLALICWLLMLCLLLWVAAC